MFETYTRDPRHLQCVAKKLPHVWRETIRTHLTHVRR